MRSAAQAKKPVKIWHVVDCKKRYVRSLDLVVVEFSMSLVIVVVRAVLDSVDWLIEPKSAAMLFI